MSNDRTDLIAGEEPGPTSARVVQPSAPALSAPKWTPGPWKRGTLARDIIFGADWKVIAEVLQRLSKEESEANVALIAAAPDLYAALEAVLSIIWWAHGDGQHYQAAKAALAKARGERAGIA
jgi:hypothetical protein